MSAAQDDVEFSLAPQWLRGHGHGPQSPAGAGRTSAGRRGTQSLDMSSSGRRSTAANLLECSKTQAASSGSDAEYSADVSSARTITAGSRPLGDNQAVSKVSLGDRYSSSSRNSKQGPSFNSSDTRKGVTPWSSRHAEDGMVSLRPAGATETHHSLGLTRQQRTHTQGRNTTTSAMSKKPSLEHEDFPRLGSGVNSSSGSNRRHGSPQPYTPSIAPYKQEFLASTAGWTSKLAVVPNGADQGTGSSKPLLQPTATGTQHTQAASSTVPSDEADASIATTSAPDSAALVVEPTAPSLAQTLKQAVAAADRGVAARGSSKVNSKALVPLMPGSKAKRGSMTSAVAPGSADRSAKPPARAAAGAGKAAGPCASGSHIAASAQSSLVTLGFHGSSSLSLPAAVGQTAVAAAARCKIDNYESHSSSQVQQQHSKLPVGAGDHVLSEQRHQANDRNSFFAVLRKKTCSSSSQSCSRPDGEGATGTQACVDHARHIDALVSTDVASERSKTAAQELQSICTPSVRDDSHVEDQSPADNNGGCGAIGTKVVPIVQQKPPCSAATAVGHQVNPSVLIPVDSTHASNAVLCSENNVALDASLAEEVLELGACDSTEDSFRMDSGVVVIEVSKGREASTEQVCSKQQLPQSEVAWNITVTAEEEEEAFLRSLGWTAASSDADEDWELTAEEIAAFQASAVVRAAQQQQQQQYASGFSKALLSDNSDSLSDDTGKQNASWQQWHSDCNRGVIQGKGVVGMGDVMRRVLGVHALGHGQCGTGSPMYKQSSTPYLLSCDSDCSSSSSSSNEED